MRAAILCLWILAYGVATPVAFAESEASPLEAKTSPDIDASCRIPFETLKDSKTGEAFPMSAAINENEKLLANLRQRYIVADLSTTDGNGFCRGVQEHITPVSELSELRRLKAIATARQVDIVKLASEPIEKLAASEASPGDPAALALELEDLRNYLQQVDRYKTDPVIKQPVFNGYCVGQTLSFCEIVNGQPKLVYRFVTSSSKYRPPINLYYAPINVVRSRSWSSDRRYTPADAKRDARMGGGSAGIVPFANGGRPIEMPNFLHFVPASGYVGEKANGIHQIAGGLDSGGQFGAPVSLGCLRLGRFQSKLARWWIPTQAKLFVHFESGRYYTYGVKSTGKALGFKAPPPPQAETAAVMETPASRPSVSRAKKKRAPSAGLDDAYGFLPFGSSN